MLPNIVSERAGYAPAGVMVDTRSNDLSDIESEAAKGIGGRSSGPDAINCDRRRSRKDAYRDDNGRYGMHMRLPDGADAGIRTPDLLFASLRTRVLVSVVYCRQVRTNAPPLDSCCGNGIPVSYRVGQCATATQPRI